MVRVVIIGGGWAGCSAALAAKKAGAEVLLLERTDMLLGCGLAGGIMRNNGRYTAAEELKCLGGGELIEIADALSLHKGIAFPGHRHASLYDTAAMEPAVRRLLKDMDVEIRFEARAVDAISADGNRIDGVFLPNECSVEGDVFVEATGSAGGMSNCSRYGNGCVTCMLRCPSFGPRTSLTQAAGIEDYTGIREDGGRGSFSGSCELNKNSLAPGVRRRLEADGVVVIPLPERFVDTHLLKLKACHQYARREYVANVILLDTGRHAKMMMPFCALERLRTLPGLERACYEHSSGRGNSLRFFSRAPRDNTMRVLGLENLFCAGEKSGFFVGHTEAMFTGALAGYNSVRHALGKQRLELPVNLAGGDLIAFENRAIREKGGLGKRYTFAGGAYFDRLVRLKLYTTDHDAIARRVEAAGLTGIFSDGGAVDATDFFTGWIAAGAPVVGRTAPDTPEQG